MESSELDIHNSKRMIEQYLKKINEYKDINEKNKELLLRYHRDNVISGLALPTQVKHLQVMYWVSRQFNGESLAELRKEDIEKIAFEIRQMPKSPWTIHKYLVGIKKFYKWFNGGTYPEKVAWIKTTVKDANQKLPEDLLTLEEVKKMLNACENDRDRCFISILNELGARIGEILPIKIKNLTQDGRFYRITLQKSKTKPRRLKVIDSAPQIGKWLNSHPTKNPEDFLFVGIGSKNKGERWAYDAARMALAKIAKRGGVKKAVYPHNWRHSTATRYAQKMTSAQLCYWFGWKQGSSMAQVYLHLSGEDLDDVVDEMRGIKKKEKKVLTLSEIECRYCGTQNPGNLDFCEKCGATLTTVGGVQKDEEFETFKKETEARQKVIEDYLVYLKEKIVGASGVPQNISKE